MESASEFSQRRFMFLRIATGWIDRFCFAWGYKSCVLRQFRLTVCAFRLIHATDAWIISYV